MSKGGVRSSQFTLDGIEVHREQIAALSTREEEVLSYAASGYLDKQIGMEMGVSLNTLRTYWQRIRAKVGDVPRTALAVAYSDHLAAISRATLQENPEHDWEMDLETDIVRLVSSRAIPVDLPVEVDLTFEEVVATYHPEDQPRVRALVASVKRGELNAFTFTARRISPVGIRSSSAFVQVQRDKDGNPVKIIGRRIPQTDEPIPAIERIQVGYWTRDIESGEFWADGGFREIFRVAPEVEDLREAAMGRFHPEEIEGCRTFVDDAAKARKERTRRTHRLVYDDGTVRWITTDLRIEYEEDRPLRALGTVMAFK